MCTYWLPSTCVQTCSFKSSKQRQWFVACFLCQSLVGGALASVQSTCNERATRMARACNVRATSVERVWHERGTSVERARNGRGTCVGRAWNERGTSVERVWHARGTSAQRACNQRTTSVALRFGLVPSCKPHLCQWLMFVAWGCCPVDAWSHLWCFKCHGWATWFWLLHVARSMPICEPRRLHVARFVPCAAAHARFCGFG